MKLENRVIAVDLDEVLGSFVLQLCRFHNDTYGTDLNVSDFHSYHFADVWGGTSEAALQKVFQFFQSHYFTDIPPVDGALIALQRLKAEGATLYVVTSRQQVIEEATKEWLSRHYLNIFDGVYFGNHYALEGKSISKPDMCKLCGAHVLIDDNLGYAQQCAAANIRVILFDHEGAYPWNKTEAELHVNIVRLHSWEAVVDALLNMSM
jgi:uncharacterized HAD superfamily protein